MNPRQAKKLLLVASTMKCLCYTQKNNVHKFLEKTKPLIDEMNYLNGIFGTVDHDDSSLLQVSFAEINEQINNLEVMKNTKHIDFTQSIEQIALFCDNILDFLDFHSRLN